MLDSNKIKAFAGDETEYYVQKWEAIEKGSVIGESFNGAAFLFNIFWLLYRKLYWQALLVVLAFVVVAIFVEASTSVGVLLAKYGGLIVMVILGTWGNYLYLKKYQKTVRNSELLSSGPEEQMEYLRAKGGTANLLVILLIVVVCGWVGLEVTDIFDAVSRVK